MALIFDIETDGLLDNVSKIHCLVIRGTETGPQSFVGDKIEEGLKILSDAHLILGHNVIKYDLPVIQKLYPWFSVDKSRVLDTLVMARLIYSNIKDIDTGLMKKGRLPGKLFGSHALKAWGYRLGEHKGDYADEFKEKAGENYKPGDEWLEFSPEMLEYCVQDTAVTAMLYEKLVSKEYSETALRIEHDAAWLIAQQERNGFCFNEKKAGELYATLAARRAELERECASLFEPWDVRLPDMIPKRDNKTRGYLAGVPVQKWKTVVFNPNSRDHIASRLQALYKWTPVDFTDGGKPKIDEVVLGKLSYPPCKLLTEFLLVQKRISQIAEGDQAWLKLVKKGKIHGSVNTNGAVTGRATHAYPNISQVPSSNSPYGHECRELFTVPPGWTLVGADASGLELRCLAHYMAKWDGGKYGNIVLDGDIHTENQTAAGLSTRSQAKTFIYAFLYGAGDEKIGSVVGGSAEDGKKLKAKFLKSLPALKNLIEAVKGVAKRGYLLGLDGRHVHVRSSHAALNTLLQSAGAIVCKKWLILLEEKLQSLGLKHGWEGDYAFCAWSHDECQIACRTKEVAEVVAKVAPEMVTEAGEFFKFRCRLNGESKVGSTWADTH